MNNERETHSVLIGYVLWIFGFMGAHRFYYGKPISGTIYFFTLGLFFILFSSNLIFQPAPCTETIRGGDLTGERERERKKIVNRSQNNPEDDGFRVFFQAWNAKVTFMPKSLIQL